MAWQLLTEDSMMVQAFADSVLQLGQSQAQRDIKVKFEKKDEPKLNVDYVQSEDYWLIQGNHPVHLYRGMSLLVKMIEEGQKRIAEDVHVTELNFMLDASRNAVMKVPEVKEFIRMIALMGYTGLYLYIEDLYEVKDYPYFGYLRGRYSPSEIKEIDEYATLFGIEVVPCIQTLAHLTQVMKWEAMGATREDDHTLLVREEASYQFIDSMLASIKNCFSSKKVHIGMDESYGVGLGTYLRKHEYTERFTLIKEHLDLVVERCRQLSLEPLVWSDFIYHTLDSLDLPGYYPTDAQIDQKKAESMPQDVTYVYWDYGEFLPEHYEKRFANHLQFGSDIMFAGGIHIYGAMTPNHGKSLKTLNPALMTCKKMGIKKIMATTWGDDGQEISHWNALPIMQWYAEHCYHQDVTEEMVSQRFSVCVAPKLYESMMAIRFLDEVPGVEELNHYMANPSKFLLWQDPLVGLFDYHVQEYLESHDLVKHYQKMSNQLQLASQDVQGIYQKNLEFYSQLATVLTSKGTLGVELQKAYQENQLEKIKMIAEKRLPSLIEELQVLHQSHRLIWEESYKPFGFEVLENRYGGLLLRLETTKKRLLDYTAGNVKSLSELSEVRLPYKETTTPLSLNVSEYRKIAFTGYH